MLIKVILCPTIQNSIWFNRIGYSGGVVAGNSIYIIGAPIGFVYNIIQCFGSAFAGFYN